MEVSEGRAAGLADNVRAVHLVLDAAGVEPIAENGGARGVTIRRREP